MKFILATDGSAYARIAEEALTKLDSARRAAISVVSVAAPLPIAVATVESPGELAGADELSRAWHIIRKATLEIAEQTAARLRERGFNATGTMLEGDPAHAILDHCEAEKADLVALGSRGMGGFMSFLLGSVARRIVSYAPCSVLVGHPPQGADPDTYAQALAAKGKLDVLACADGSDGANVAIDKLCEFGSYARGMSLCVEPLGVMPPALNPAEFGSTYLYDRDRSEQVAQLGAERLANCCDSVFHLVELGRPGSVIVDQAKANGIDLIVLGATQHGFFERFLLGSVSNEVANSAECPVLVVRIPRE